jgi:hypothetical protein
MCINALGRQILNIMIAQGSRSTITTVRYRDKSAKHIGALWKGVYSMHVVHWS